VTSSSGQIEFDDESKSTMTNSIYLSGRLVFKPELRKTKNDRDWCRILVEFSSTREVRPSEFVSETTIVPVDCFAQCAERVKGLKAGDQLTVGCHLYGTKFESDQGTRHGVQLIADVVYADTAAARAKEVAK
jgi:single-stranded DNA-binding protein